ncbi:MAG: SDR family NAD(P)-dependent oxidoreductase [Burkholderiaceae bacterium]
MHVRQAEFASRLFSFGGTLRDDVAGAHSPRPRGKSEMASVLITGSSRGIGMATVIELARCGHRVFATMRDPGAAALLAATVAAESLPIELLAMDIDSPGSVLDAIASIIEQFGVPDVLVNNAGIERHGAVEELSLDDFRTVMETNFFGALRCIQSVLPQMRARASGCIINLSSVAARASYAPASAYSASKAALEAVSEALAQEVRPFGIRVALVETGIIDTDMSHGITSSPDPSIYPHSRRFAWMFGAALKRPTGPQVVAIAIRQIVEGRNRAFRTLVGPDAAPLLKWRAEMSDEKWIDWGAQDDDSWYASVKRGFV